jgi:TRAP-type C4-dicarboxylate transport system permease small subunit
VREVLVSKGHDDMNQLRRLMAGIGFLALLAMVGVALTDIVLRLISRLPGTPFAKVIPVAVPGVVDWVELTLVTVAHLSVAVTFMVGTHVTVDVVANTLPAGLRRITRRIAWALSFAFMVLCFFTALDQGRGSFSDGVVSPTISLPMWWYWVPVVIGTGLAALACFVHMIGRRNTGQESL